MKISSLIRLSILGLLILNELLFSQVYKITGSISTPNSPVKYALVSFINAKDTTQKYSVITDTSGNYQLDILTGIEKNEPSIPSGFELAQNYPNPFSNTTAIEYKLNEPANINLVIYDMLGQEVKRFILGEKNTGINKVLWNGRNNFGQQVSPGIYLYQLVSGSDKVTKKMVMGMGSNTSIQLNTLNSIPKSSGNKNLKTADNSQLVFKVAIKNIDTTSPQIYDTVFTDLIIHSDTNLDFKVKEVELAQAFIIQGKILTALSPVKYADIEFINKIDSTKRFLTISDSLGNFMLTVLVSPNESEYKAEIKNTDTTKPQIYNRLFNTIKIQNDTTINFTLEAVGPWVKVKRNLPSGLNDIDFPDSANGWVVGYKSSSSGLLLHTVDGGQSWEEKTCPIEDRLIGVDFVDSQTGWICSKNSILKTIDGGETWLVKYYEDFGFTGLFRDIKFLTDKIGFAVGGKGAFGSIGVLLKTTDGGEIWENLAKEDLYTLYQLSIVDENNIWICGYDGALLKSTDLGLTWINKSLNYPGFFMFTTIQFVDQFNGWIGCEDDEPFGFFRTTDGGETWIQGPRELYLALGIQAFFFIDKFHGWLSPFLGGGTCAIIKSTDSGQTWGLLPEGTSLSRINSFCFFNEGLGWAVGIEPINAKPKGVILLYQNTK